MLSVTGIGMVSALGLDAVSSCAAARAGINRIVQIDDLIVNDDEGELTSLVAVHRVPRISRGFFGFARLVQLGTAGLADLLGSTGPHEGARLGFILLVGGEDYRRAWLSRVEQEPGLDPERDVEADRWSLASREQRIQERLLPTLLQASGLEVVPEATRVSRTTGVGFIDALAVAREWLANGTCDRCVLGGLDSLLDPTTLEALDRLRMLKTPENPAAMIPGEAACFLMLENPEAAAAGGMRARVTLESPTSARGVAHPSMHEGSSDTREAAAGVVTESLSRLPDGGEATGLLVANSNGDPYRGEGLGQVLAQALTPIGRGDLPVWLPPAFFGETGAATGPLSIALLMRGWDRDYVPSQRAVVCLMDDLGARGAVHVRAQN